MAWLKQKAGNGAQLVQAQTVNYGISVKDAEHICLRLMKEHLERYSQEAFNIAKERVDEFALNYLNTLNEQAPQAIENLKDPGVQSAVLDAEAGFAKSGDVGLGEILVQMLVERTKEKERTIKQLALNEAISAAQRLTSKHLAAVSLLFFLKRTQMQPPSLESFREGLAALLSPMCEDFGSFTLSDGRYLEATGCAVRSLGEATWPFVCRERYPGIFYKGFVWGETPSAEQISSDANTPVLLFVPAEEGRVKVNAITEEDAINLARVAGLPDEKSLVPLMKQNPMSDEEIDHFLSDVVPGLSTVFAAWQSAGLHELDPSLTGISIAHANFKRKAQQAFQAEIDVWIN
ncbi:LPO_1073/Vpar_1526 family protein [Streptomyces sp. NPDC006658]|uniref:LPO_1073/Vpar_1526 family protein n=1 Tax=Streptomyces sp. NPDC006658 TaxID=3156900 RepID=UPI0034094C14